MTRLVGRQPTHYPVLHRWLHDGLGNTFGNARLLDTFTRHSGLGATEAKAAVQPDADPIVFVEDLQGAYGQFSAASPKVISLGRQIVKALEDNAADDAARRLVEMTVLHELIHWAWAGAGRAEPPRRDGMDIGDLFAAEAYGAVEFLEAGSSIERQAEVLGTLSRAYESKGRPGAIGHDTNGGWSYGLYQLSARQGTLGAFLDHLVRLARTAEHAAAYSARLLAAGGEKAAVNGTEAFQAAWRTCAAEEKFADIQHEFIKETHYDPFVRKLLSSGIALASRSLALKDVAWSVSVQHGPGRTEIFENPWKAMSPQSRLDDAQFINAIYHERSRVDVYFSQSNEREKKAVLDRFRDERDRALKMLRLT